VAWVTMKKDAPLIANVMLDGILPENLKLPDTEEPGTKRKIVPTYPVSGTLTVDGKPLAGVTVTFHAANKDGKYQNVCDGLTDDRGRFQMSTYTRFDGAPAGEFTVTAVRTGRGYYDGEVPDKSLMPEKYATPAKSSVKVTVKDGANDLRFDLTSK